MTTSQKPATAEELLVMNERRGHLILSEFFKHWLSRSRNQILMCGNMGKSLTGHDYCLLLPGSTVGLS